MALHPAILSDAIRSFFDQVFEHSELFSESRPDGTHGLNYWVHPVQADSIQKYVAGNNQFGSTWVYEEMALQDVSQRLLHVFLLWAQALFRTPNSAESFQVYGIRSLSMSNNRAKELWAHVPRIFEHMRMTDEIFMRMLIEQQLTSKLHNLSTSSDFSSCLTTLGTCFSTMLGSPATGRPHHGIYCGFNPFSTFVWFSRVQLVILYSSGMSMSKDRRMSERKLFAYSMLEIIIDRICRSHLRVSDDTNHPPDLVNKLIHRLHPYLSNILKSHSRMDFLQAALKQFEEIAERTETNFRATTREFTRLDLSKKTDIHTYFKQRLQVLGLRSLTHILEVWLAQFKRVPFTPKGDEGPRTTEEAASLASLVLCSVLEKSELSSYYSQARARTDHWKFDVIHDVFRVKTRSLRYDNGDEAMRFIEVSDLEQLEVLDYM